MNMDQYQKQAARTRVDREYRDALVYGALGLAGEAGEAANKIKKVVYHAHPENLPEIIEELGDVLWHIAEIATVLEVDLHTIAAANIGKLLRRYPDGFDTERSINRDDGPASQNEVVNEHVVYVPPTEGLKDGGLARSYGYE